MCMINTQSTHVTLQIDKENIPVDERTETHMGHVATLTMQYAQGLLTREETVDAILDELYATQVELGLD